MASIGVAGAAKPLPATCVRKLCVLSRLSTEDVRNCHSAAFLRVTFGQQSLSKATWGREWPETTAGSDFGVHVPKSSCQWKITLSQLHTGPQLHPASASGRGVGPYPSDYF